MKKITKAHIICNLIAKHGPMCKAELLKATALIEGKPYKSASNNSYFLPFKNPLAHGRRYGGVQSKTSLVANGTLEVVCKKGNTLFYGLTPKGVLKVEEYKRIIGV